MPNEVLRQILLPNSSQKFCWVESNNFRLNCILKIQGMRTQVPTTKYTKHTKKENEIGDGFANQRVSFVIQLQFRLGMER